MSTHFDPNARSLLVEAIISGPRRVIAVKLLLDTGATATMIRPRFLMAAGYDLAAASRHRRFRSATGGGAAPVLDLSRVDVLDCIRTAFPVAVHDPPPAVIADGLLGLDFFRGQVLTLDFARGRVALRPPKAWWQVWR